MKSSYKQARGNLLMMKPLPTISQAYRLVHQEERDNKLSEMTNERDYS